MVRSTRDKLVDAAAACVRTLGLRKVAVRHVLDEAQFSRRTFYQHFSSRDDVIRAVYSVVCEELVETVEARVASTPHPAAQLRAGIEAYLDYQVAGGLLVRDLQAEAVFPGSQLFPLREMVLDQLVEILDGGVTRTLSVRVDPLQYRALLIGLEGLVIKLRRGHELTPSARDQALDLALPMFEAIIEQAARVVLRRSPEAGQAGSSPARHGV